MRDAPLFIYHLVACCIRLLRPGGVKSIAAENLILRQQLIVMNRSRRRSPSLTSVDRSLFAIRAHFIRQNRLRKLAIIVKPATILRFHGALVKRKYRLLYTSKNVGKPGPRGPQPELVKLVEVKTVPYTPLSHPFVERVIGSVRREFLDQLLFWNGRDLSRKLSQYFVYYNETRGHLSLNGKTPEQSAGNTAKSKLPIENYSWISHCNGQFSTPIAC